MDKCTHEVRKQRWKNIIGQCLQRPEGMTAKQWLDENNICEQTYYHWLKRIRQETYELAQLIGTKYDMNPFEKNVLFLFCGGRGDRIKGLLWEGNEFLLLYKRLENGSFSWPRTPEEAMQLTRGQYEMLMMGLNPVHPKIRDVHPQKIF